MPAPTGTDMATTISSATGKQQEEEEVVSQKVHAVLEDSPEYREALARSKRIEEDLQVIRAGTQLWKVRSFSKWFHRKFFIDGEEGHLKYEPSHKNSCIFGGPEFIAVTDIVDVRRGWKTDTFNKFGSKVVGEQKKHKLRRQRKLRGAADSGAAGQDDGQDRSLVDEACCFSIVYGDSRRTLDLVASTPQVATVWVRALRHVVTVLRGLNHEKRFVVWLQKQFEQADVDRSGTLSFDECLHLLQQLNVKMSKKEALRIFMLADTNKQNDEASGEPCLDAEEFIQFYQLLMKRPDIEEIYHQYARSAKEMTPEELQRFLKKEQHMAEVTVEECRSMIDAFEQSELKNSGRLSISAFQHLLISEQFAVMDYRCKSVYQDMDEPLSSYFIATSHNTYLLGRQVVAESSIEGYVSALRRGCRLLELDCWDGPDGEPVVTHGYALTSKLVFREVLKDAILPNAFAVSEYPVILSLENHCTPTQQKRLAFHITDIFGDLLYLEEMSPDMETLPSPNQLKRRIIIKGRKAAPVQTPESESEDEDEMDSLSPKKQPPNNQSSSDTESSTPPTPVLSGRPSPPDNVTKSSKSSSRRKSLQNSQLEKVTDQNLSDLVNVCQGVHFHGFKEPGNCYEMVSLSESKATKLLEKNGDDLVRFNTRRLSKVYPSGTRTGSTNFMPWPFWNGGCQLVALNYQGSKEPVFINEAKFRDNGGCGFVLKPDFMRLPDFSKFGYNPTATSVSQLVGLKDRRRLFEIRIISGLYIPKPEGEGLSDIVDPYVKVKIIGHPIDKREKQTHVVHDNGFNPRWNSTFKFVVNVPELAFLYFIVKDETPGRHDPTVGSYALPFTCIAPGYRQVPLLDMKRRPLGPAHLFIHTKITEISY